ncbi:molybdenum ABC transporter ATP-binding protein [Aquicoccus sp. SCR17]|nr:molybdenum ABC transporter ATP-binding protein [Carideicomes alvinocaridis]
MSLEVRIRHDFPGFRLDVEFEVPQGITVLFGRSGSGKTSVINAVAGLFRPDEARIRAGERVLCDTARGLWLPPHRRRLGYVFQEARLFPHLTVRQNLAYGRWFAPRGARGADRAQVVEMLGIGPLLDRRPGALSGGEKARVAIGRALLAAPELILADEPLASLDEARKAEILPYFERLRDESPVPILYVSHSAAEVARLATSVVGLEDGRVTGQGPVAEVLGDPASHPLGVRAAGAVIAARVVRHDADGLSELEAGGVPLVVPRVAAPPGAELRLRIAAQDVIVATARPEGLSAMNLLPGRIEALHPGEGPGMMVQIATPAGRVLARITRRSAERLGLAVGMECHAVLKTVAVAREDVGGAGGESL